VSSFAWQIALNLSQASWFSGLENFDFLGDHNPLNLAGNFINVKISDGCTREIFFQPTKLFGWRFTYSILVVSNASPRGLSRRLRLSKISGQAKAVLRP